MTCMRIKRTIPKLAKRAFSLPQADRHAAQMAGDAGADLVVFTLIELGNIVFFD